MQKKSSSELAHSLRLRALGEFRTIERNAYKFFLVIEGEWFVLEEQETRRVIPGDPLGREFVVYNIVTPGQTHKFSQPVSFDTRMSDNLRMSVKYNEPMKPASGATTTEAITQGLAELTDMCAYSTVGLTSTVTMNETTRTAIGVSASDWQSRPKMGCVLPHWVILFRMDKATHKVIADVAIRKDTPEFKQMVEAEKLASQQRQLASKQLGVSNSVKNTLKKQHTKKERKEKKQADKLQRAVPLAMLEEPKPEPALAIQRKRKLADETDANEHDEQKEEEDDRATDIKQQKQNKKPKKGSKRAAQSKAGAQQASVEEREQAARKLIESLGDTRTFAAAAAAESEIEHF
jgi:hypothetical protein